MKFVSLIALAALIASPAIAQEAGQFEAGVGYNVWDAEDGDLGVLSARGTYMFNQNFGVEGELGTGITEEDTVLGEVKIGTSFGGFAVARAPLAETFSLFGRVGYATTEVEVDTGVGSGSADLDGVAYGVGGILNVTPNFGIRGEFSQYDGGDDVDGQADVWGVSAVLKF
jgi:outer membrane immunogenic protein